MLSVSANDRDVVIRLEQVDFSARAQSASIRASPSSLSRLGSRTEWRQRSKIFRQPLTRLSSRPPARDVAWRSKSGREECSGPKARRHAHDGRDAAPRARGVHFGPEVEGLDVTHGGTKTFIRSEDGVRVDQRSTLS